MVVYDESPWKLPRMIAALLSGPGVLADEDVFGTPVMLGFAVHYTLSLLYALALAGVLAGLRREHAPIAGLLFGVALYSLNLHGFTQLFPWFAEMRTVDTFVAHAIFGVVAAGAYCEFSRPRGDEELD
jgi:ABC-type transport system involved in cytochrome c biogenesis permease subunit